MRSVLSFLFEIVSHRCEDRQKDLIPPLVCSFSDFFSEHSKNYKIF